MSYWYDILPNHSLIMQNRQLYSLALKDFIQKSYNVDVRIKGVRVLKKTRTKITIDPADINRFGLKFRGKPCLNTKCGSIHFQDFAREYEGYIKEEGKPDRLTRLCYSDLLYILWDMDILLQKVDFSSKYKNDVGYKSRPEDRRKWVLFGIKCLCVIV